MFRFVWVFFGMLVRLFRGRQSLLFENLALRQQLVALKRRHPRPSLRLSISSSGRLLGGSVPHPGHAGNRRPLAPD